MKIRCIAISLLFCFFGAPLFVGAAFAQDANPSVAQERAATAYADKLEKEWLTRGIPGLELAVAVDGKVVYSKPLGCKDKEHNIPAQRTTKFRVGSISKSLTGVALMRLVQQRKISLDDPIKKYLPKYPHGDK